jgi:hypothetical protein
MRPPTLTAIFAIGNLLAAGSAVSADFTFYTVDVPRAVSTVAFGINDREQIVGIFSDSAGSGGGFIYSGGTFTMIDLPGEPFGINNRGQIVGVAGFHGFLRDTDGSVTTIDVPGGFQTEAFGINVRGQIVGRFRDARTGHYLGFLRQPDGSFATIVTRLQDAAIGINDRGQIVGCFGASEFGFLRCEHGYLRQTDGSFVTIDVPGAVFPGAGSFFFPTFPSGINTAGDLVGTFQDQPGGGLHGAVYSDGEFTTIDVPGSSQTNAIGINNSREIVGHYVDTAGGEHGFLAIPGAATN